MKVLVLSISLLLLLFIISCENVISDLGVEENLVVIDGWVYDTEGPHEIRLSRSVAFESETNFTPLNNAVIIIRDDQSNIETLSQVAPGVYHTKTDFEGRIGFSYQVEVTLSNGETYISDFANLRPVAEIQRLIIEESSFFIQDQGIDEVFFYFPVAFVQEPIEMGNFYRWRVAKNHVFFNEPEDILLQTDRFINGNFFRNELTDYRYMQNDTATVRLESLTVESYNFLRFLRRQTTSLGSPSGTNPGILKGNIRNKSNDNEVVLGYFGASAVSEATEVVFN